MGNYWNVDEWRWHCASSPATGQRSIKVIEPAEEKASPRGHRVPFGFARELAGEPAEPRLWEGDQA